jgi:hypothetical protein
VDETEKRVLANIEKHGCHVWHIGGEGDLPAFEYSVGIQKTCGAPEIIIIGLKTDTAHWAINEYCRIVRTGKRFSHGEQSDAFFRGIVVTFLKVERIHYAEYFGWNRWLYHGDNFDVVQLIWPSAEGSWPWQPAAEDFQREQPLLAKRPDLHLH